MNTFVPYSDYNLSAKCLDFPRLRGQRNECKVIIHALLLPNEVKGWKNHSATVMWRGYELSLLDYYFKIIDEWINRNYHVSDDTIKAIIGYYSRWAEQYPNPENAKFKVFNIDPNSSYPDWLQYTHFLKSVVANSIKPNWVTDQRTLDGFRSNLIRKNAAHYQPMWPNVPNDLSYTYGKI